jgi:hypothetical protein
MPKDERSPTKLFVKGLDHYALTNQIIMAADLEELANSEQPCVPSFSLGSAQDRRAAESRVFGPLVKRGKELDWTAVRGHARTLLTEIQKK